MNLPQNMGTVDKVIRTIVGVGLIALVFVGPQTPWGWLGLIPLATVVTGWCPGYSLLGITSRGGIHKEHPQAR